MARKPKASRRIPYGYERHHIFWTRKNWIKSPYSRQLRQELIIVIKTKEHRKLHENCRPVPVPSEDVCKYLLRITHILYRWSNKDITKYIIQQMDGAEYKDFTDALREQLPYF